MIAPLRLRGVVIYLSVGLIAALAIWTINAELLHFGGAALDTKGEVRLDRVVTPADLDADHWRIGAINMKDDQGVYQVTVVDASAQELFKLTLNAGTGVLSGRKKGGGSKKNVLPVEEVRRRIEPLLPELTVGEVVKRSGKPFAQADLLHDGAVVARIKVDPDTGRPYDPATAVKERRAGMKQRKWVPGWAVLPLGWLGGGLAMIGTFYFSWRRSLLGQLRLDADRADSARLALVQTLRIHCWLSFGAAALIVVHIANDWGRVTWSVSWMALLLVIVVTGNGVLGKLLQDRGAGLADWRRFHLPVVAVLCLLLVAHILDQMGVFSVY